jgi:Zn-finger nucleic acid-binding protein
MKCLNCHNITEISDYKEITNYFCPNCQGYWVPGETVRKLSKQKRLKVDQLKAIRATNDNTRGLICPTDKINLKTVKVRGIEIDVCPDCLGIYFDKDEINQLVDYKEKKGSPPSGSLLLAEIIAIFFDAVFSGMG